MGLFIKIVNDKTGSKSYGNYNYEVSVNGEIIESGKVTNYPRVKGAGQLIKLVGMDIDRKKFIETLRKCDYDKKNLDMIAEKFTSKNK